MAYRLREQLMLYSLRTFLNQAVRVSPRTAGQVAYQLLCRPRRWQWSAEEAAFLDDAHQMDTAIGGDRIRTYDWPPTECITANPPTVLLAHGWESSTARWVHLLSGLRATGWRVVALDAPAHGQSSGSHFTVVRYAAALGTIVERERPQALVGHSAGGMAAVYYLTHHHGATMPERLVLLAVPSELTDFIYAFGRTLSLNRTVIDALERVFIELTDHSFHYYSMREFVRSLTIPGLVVHDRTDDVAPLSGIEELVDNWGQAELLITEGLGHSLRSDAVDEHIVAYLQRELLLQ